MTNFEKRLAAAGIRPCAPKGPTRKEIDEACRIPNGLPPLTDKEWAELQRGGH